jgi:hypothetical protein
VVNWGAGIEDSILDMEQITRTLERGMKTVIRLINTLLATSDR